MKVVFAGVASVVLGLAASGCSTMPGGGDLTSLLPASSPVTTGSVPKTAEKRGLPVVKGRAARMYVWAAFLEKDCSPVDANITISKAPTKGTVSFRDKQPTLVQHSLSGKCVGQTIEGKGVYYTANKGADGDDTFEVTATSPSGTPVTKTFNVRIVDRIGG